MVPNRLVKKLIIILSATMLLACFVTGYITYRLQLNESEKEIAEQFAQRVEQVAAKVDLRLQDVYRLSDQIVINPIIVETLGRMNRGERISFEEHSELIRNMNPMLLSLPNLLSFYVFDLQGNYFMPSNSLLNNELGAVARQQVNSALQHSDGELVWVRGEFRHNETGPFSNSETGMVVAARWMKDTSMNNYGVLVLVLNQSIMSNDLNMAIKGDDSRAYLFDNDRLLYSDEEDLEAIDIAMLSSIEREGIYSVQGTPYMFAQSTTETDRFKLVSRISMKTLQEKRQLLMIVTFASALVSVLLAVLLSYLASRRLLLPLKKLVQGMRKVRGGDLKARVHVQTNDEFAYIGESFNSMVEHVDALIKEVYIKQLREREAELTALQASLNPHFLYNTLDMIHSKLYLQDDKVTAGLIVSLSGLLRYALEPASSETTFADELKQINNYLRLQKARFENDLIVSVEVEDDVKQCGIIRLLLQPLVENAFVHGFRDHTGIKHLSLRAFRKGDELIVEVRDNGCGMSADTIRRLDPKRPGRAFTEEESLGVHNVVRRIELYYGPTYGLKFISEAGEGTLARVRLPYRILRNDQKGEIAVV